MSFTSGSDELRGACPTMLCEGSCVHSDNLHAHALEGARSCASASMRTAEGGSVEVHAEARPLAMKGRSSGRP